MTDTNELPDSSIAAEFPDGLVSARYDGKGVGHNANIVHDTWTSQVHKSLMAPKTRLADIFGMSEIDLQPVSREAIGHRLRLTREALGLGLTEFAGKLDMSKTRYENFEAGRNLMKPEAVLTLIRAFPLAKLDFNWIYHGDLNGVAHDVAEKITKIADSRAVA